jgi:DNA-binding transcriptional regulator YiaG
MKKLSKKYQKKHIPFDEKFSMELYKKGKIQLQTVERWKEQGFMPEHYKVPSNCVKIGEKTLTKLREEKGLSQQDFTKIFNNKYSVEVSTVSVSNWETGKFKPSKMYKKLLDSFFDV